MQFFYVFALPLVLNHSPLLFEPNCDVLHKLRCAKENDNKNRNKRQPARSQAHLRVGNRHWTFLTTTYDTWIRSFFHNFLLGIPAAPAIGAEARLEDF